jgi:hypothetical protein
MQNILLVGEETLAALNIFFLSQVCGLSAGLLEDRNLSHCF